MICEDCTIYLTRKEETLVVGTQDKLSALERLVGLFPMGVGGLVLYVFLSGGGPTPVGSLSNLILGYAIWSIPFVAAGLLPFFWGFGMIFLRDRFIINTTEQLAMRYLTIAGIPVLRWGFLLPVHGLCVERRYFKSKYSGEYKTVVSCTNDFGQLDIVRFEDEDRAKAEALAADLATALGLPVTSPPQLPRETHSEVR